MATKKSVLGAIIKAKFLVLDLTTQGILYDEEGGPIYFTSIDAALSFIENEVGETHRLDKDDYQILEIEAVYAVNPKTTVIATKV